MEPPPRIADLTLLRRIGHGSYGDVWIARTLTGVYRAVKVVARSRFEDERPFLRELDGITRFQQAVGDRPRQLALMHVGRDDERGFFYYVMELADDAQTGTDIDPDRYLPLTLKEYMRRGPVTAADAVRLGIELVEALVELHAAGLIHRDVKPSNIIFVGGMPKLADIGLVSSSDHTLTSLGTPGYSPPEGAGTTKADVYSLGKILYQLVTGLPPQDFPRLPPDLMNRADAAAVMELNEVVLRACDPQPEQRYDQAQAMLDDLLLLQAGKSVVELHRVRRHLRQLARVSAIVAALALVVLGGMGWINYQQARALAAQERSAREQAELDEQLARYTADLGSAQLGLATGDYGLARHALRRQIPPSPGEPDPRGPEWYALWHDTTGDAVESFGEIGTSGWRLVLPSPDGRLVALQNLAGETWIAERSGRQQRRLAEGTHGCAGFSADGTRLLVGTQDRKVRWLDVATGEAGPDLPVTGRLQGMGDGRRFVIGEAVGNGIVLRVWEVAENREVGRWESGESRAELQLGGAALSPDGTRLAVALFWAEQAVPQRELIVWDVIEQRILARNSEIERVHTLRFSPDGAWIVVGMAGKPVFVVDATSGELRHQLEGHAGAVTAAAFTRDNRTLATSGRDQSIRLWNLATGSSRSLRGHEGNVLSLVFAEEDSRLLSGSADGTWRVWPVEAAAPGNAADGLWANVLGDFAFAPDAAAVVATDRSGGLVVLDPVDLDVVRTLPGVFQPLGFDGASVVGVSREFRLVRAELGTGNVREEDLQMAGPNQVRVLMPSRDGRRAVFGLRNGEVEIWDLPAARSLGRSKPHEASVDTAALADDGEWAVTGDTRGHVWLWSGARGTPERKLVELGQPVTSLAFTPGDRVLVGTNDGSLRVIDLRTGESMSERRGHSRAVVGLAISPDGRRLWSGGNDGVVLAWRLPDLRQLATLLLTDPGVPLSERGVYRLRTSPQGTELGAMTEDGRFRRWRLGPAP